MRTAFVILWSLLTMNGGHPFTAGVQLDPFDSNGVVSWEDEKAHLDNFAITLRHDPDAIGYWIFKP